MLGHRGERCGNGDPVRSAQFGTVYKAIGVDCGKLIVVKILKRPVRGLVQEGWKP
jgi:hypothetical protein